MEGPCWWLGALIKCPALPVFNSLDTPLCTPRLQSPSGRTSMFRGRQGMTRCHIRGSHRTEEAVQRGSRAGVSGDRVRSPDSSCDTRERSAGHGHASGRVRAERGKAGLIPTGRPSCKDRLPFLCSHAGGELTPWVAGVGARQDGREPGRRRSLILSHRCRHLS